MKKFVYFIISLVQEINKNEIIPLATELTYRLIFALFPFIIFLMSLIGYFNIDSSYLFNEMSGIFPNQIMEVINVFIDEVVDVKSAGVLSTSLIISIYSASSGFNAMIRGINKAYAQKETRSFVMITIISIFLVIVLAFAIITSLLVLIYGDSIYKMLQDYFQLGANSDFLFGMAGNLITLLILISTIIIIYKFGSCKRLTYFELIPGALITLIVWVVASKIFNIYVNNFAKYAKVYGSIASIFITMLWLNIISIVILIGAQINSMVSIKSHKKNAKI